MVPPRIRPLRFRGWSGVVLTDQFVGTGVVVSHSVSLQVECQVSRAGTEDDEEQARRGEMGGVRLDACDQWRRDAAYVVATGSSTASVHSICSDSTARKNGPDPH
jgi:hypothetical protein